VTGNHVTRPQVTASDMEVTSFGRKSLEAAVEGCKLAYTVHFTSYKTVSRCSWQSRNMK